MSGVIRMHARTHARTYFDSDWYTLPLPFEVLGAWPYVQTVIDFYSEKGKEERRKERGREDRSKEEARREERRREDRSKEEKREVKREEGKVRRKGARER